MLQVTQQSNQRVMLFYVPYVRINIFGMEIAVSRARHTKLLLIWQQVGRLLIAAG
jgi:hypothetical protein